MTEQSIRDLLDGSITLFDDSLIRLLAKHPRSEITREMLEEQLNEIVNTSPDERYQSLAYIFLIPGIHQETKSRFSDRIINAHLNALKSYGINLWNGYATSMYDVYQRVRGDCTKRTAKRVLVNLIMGVLTTPTRDTSQIPQQAFEELAGLGSSVKENSERFQGYLSDLENVEAEMQEKKGIFEAYYDYQRISRDEGSYMADAVWRARDRLKELGKICEPLIEQREGILKAIRGILH